MKGQGWSWRWVPTWLPVAVCVVTMLCNVGASYATFGGRIAETERRISAVEEDRAVKLRDYDQFKTDVRSDLAEMRTDLKWIRTTLEQTR